jgi:hypothetical protein
LRQDIEYVLNEKAKSERIKTPPNQP